MKENQCLVNLYISSTADLTVSGGKVKITQQTDYPESGTIRIQVSAQQDHPFDLGLRIPGWSRTYEVTLDGESHAGEAGASLSIGGNEAGCSSGVYKNGYFYLRNLTGEHEIILKLCMEPRFWRADPRVRDDVGKVALTRGPVVYCLEEVDNGKNLHLLSVDPAGKTEGETEDGELGHIMADETEPQEENVRLSFIPYYTWANRGSNEMSVWVRTV